jgi:hypothetical protein
MPHHQQFLVELAGWVFAGDTAPDKAFAGLASSALSPPNWFRHR